MSAVAFFWKGCSAVRSIPRDLDWLRSIATASLYMTLRQVSWLTDLWQQRCLRFGLPSRVSPVTFVVLCSPLTVTRSHSICNCFPFTLRRCSAAAVEAPDRFGCPSASGVAVLYLFAFPNAIANLPPPPPFGGTSPASGGEDKLRGLRPLNSLC